ncbi:Sec-independent protein translocase subunit TatA [Nocardia salmonicida]|uniref:Sec-independent protein translocase subunit TatA n=1 Tax=Nocardia TaxID=1817 RepID=UPI00265843D4|nr:Sec-independent protein translocase subunit TatA [Nocardia sp. PE-7]WKG12014.1 Sec-independent protein translocase subunit TatA [Nocardia sp. PE-7]
MGQFSVWHWLIVAAVFVLFFGAKRMPDAARGLGRSLRIFKSEVSQMQSEGADSATERPREPEVQAVSAQPTAAPHSEPMAYRSKTL